jgi:hypothetical protein
VTGEPDVVIEADEEHDRLEIPGKPEILGYLLKGSEGFGDLGFDGMR